MFRLGSNLQKQKGLTLIELMISISILTGVYMTILNFQLRNITLKNMDMVGQELASYNNGVRAFLTSRNQAFDISNPANSEIVTKYGATWNAGDNKWVLNGSSWLRSNTCGGAADNNRAFVPCTIGDATRSRGIPFVTEITAVDPGASFAPPVTGLPLELSALTSLNMAGLIDADGEMAARVAQSAVSNYIDSGTPSAITAFTSYWANDKDNLDAIPFNDVGNVYASASTAQSNEPYLRTDGTNMMNGPIRFCIDDGSVNPLDTCNNPLTSDLRVIRGINAVTFWDQGGAFNDEPTYDVAQFSGAANTVNVGSVSASGNEGHRNINNVNRVTASEFVDYDNTNFFMNPDGVTHLAKLESMDSLTYRNHIINNGGRILFDENNGACSSASSNCDQNRGMDSANFDTSNNGPEIKSSSADKTFKISTANAGTNSRIQLEHNSSGYVDIASAGGGPGYMAVNDIVLKGLGGGPGVSLLDLLPKYIFQGSELKQDGQVATKPSCPSGATPKAIVTPQNVRIASIQTNNVTFDDQGNADSPIESDGTLNTYLIDNGGSWTVRITSSSGGHNAPGGSSYAIISKYCAY